MVARYICKQFIKINVNIVQNSCRDLAVRGLRIVVLKVTVYLFNDIHDQISKLHFQGK